MVNANLERRIIDFETINPCWNLKENPIDTELLLGCDPELRPIRAKFKDLPHWFIMGDSGSGKSVLLQCQVPDLMMNYSPKAVQFVLSDLCGETFYRIPDNSPYLAQPISYSPENSIDQIQQLIKELNARQGLFQSAGVPNWESYVELMQQHNQPIVPRLIYFSNGNSDLSYTGGKWADKWGELILELVRKGRSRGINVIIAQQRGTADQISRSVASNLQGRICLKVTDKHNSIACIGQPGGESLLGKGDLLAKTKTELLKLQSPYITPSCWSQIVKISPIN